MDHNTLPAPQFELPRPQVNPVQEGLAPLEASQDLAQATELKNTELPAAAAPVSPAQAAQSVAAADPLAAINSTIPGQTTADPAAAIIDDQMPAADGDLIEKAWVQKAKTIVNQTQSDPYKQTSEMNKVKKDYIQKRYNKDVKLSED